MRLESRHWIGNSAAIRSQTERSSSIDSTDDDAKIRLDDPSLHLNLTDSPTSQPDLMFSDLCNNSTNKSSKTDNDRNMNTHTERPTHQV